MHVALCDQNPFYMKSSAAPCAALLDPPAGKQQEQAFGSLVLAGTRLGEGCGRGGVPGSSHGVMAAR